MVQKTIAFRGENYPISYKYNYQKLKWQQCSATIIVEGEEIYGSGENEELAYIDLDDILKKRV